MTVLEGVSEGAEHHVHAGAAAVAPHEPHAQHLGAERNAQWTASIRHFTDQGARKALYNTASQSPIQAHIHTPTAVTQDGSSGAVRVRRLAQGHLHTLARRGPGIEPATFRLPANPLNLLSHMQSEQTRLAKDQSHFSPSPLPLQNKGEGEGVEM